MPPPLLAPTARLLNLALQLARRNHTYFGGYDQDGVFRKALGKRVSRTVTALFLKLGWSLLARRDIHLYSCWRIREYIYRLVPNFKNFTYEFTEFGATAYSDWSAPTWTTDSCIILLNSVLHGTSTIAHSSRSSLVEAEAE